MPQALLVRGVYTTTAYNNKVSLKKAKVCR